MSGFKVLSGARGQSSAEFALILPLFIMMVLAIFGVGYAGMQRMQLDYQLAGVSDTLPAGWERMSANDALKRAIVDGTSLHADQLTVTGSTISVSTETESGADGVASSLGAVVASRQQKPVTIKGHIKYKLPALVSIMPDSVYERDVVVTATTQRRYEIS